MIASSALPDSTNVKGNIEDSDDEAYDTARPTAISGGNHESQLKSRRQQSNTSINPSPIPSSPPSLSPQPSSTPPRGMHESGNTFKKFCRIIWVDWLGGFARKLCGGRHQTFLAVLLAIAIVAMASASSLSTWPLWQQSIFRHPTST